MERLDARIAALEPAFTLVRPPGAGPFPLVVQLHGCGGRKAFQDTWAHFACAAGAVALVVDSYAHRRIGALEAYATVCLGLRLWGRERAGDLFAALAWARAQPFIRPDQMVAAGWSHGGWTVMDALALRMGAEMADATGLIDLPAEPLAGLAGAFLMYPYCGIASLSDSRGWRLAPDCVAVVGGRDRVVGARQPLRVLERLRAAGQPIDIHLLAEATHAFDEPDARDARVRYSPELAAQARGLLGGLIARVSAR